MIQKFVDQFMANKTTLAQKFSEKRPESYEDIVRAVVELLNDNEYGNPDPNRITAINHGHYQGTLLFIIASEGYQPDTYWSVKISYGSCSVCDTFESIRKYDDEIMDQEVSDYMTLALHIVQGLKEV